MTCEAQSGLLLSWSAHLNSCICLLLLHVVPLQKAPSEQSWPGLGSGLFPAHSSSQLGEDWLCINWFISLSAPLFSCSRAGSPLCTRQPQSLLRTAMCPCAPAPLPPCPALTAPLMATSPWALARPPSPSLSSALKNSPARCLSCPRTWSPLQWTETSSLVGSVSPDLKCKAWGVLMVGMWVATCDSVLSTS